MLAQADKILFKVHLEYDSKFDLQNQNNGIFVAIQKERLLKSIPETVELLSAQEDVLNKWLIRARTSFAYAKDANMIKKVETTRNAILELIKHLYSLLSYLEVSSAPAENK